MSRNPTIPVALLLALAVTAAPTARAAHQTVLGTARTVRDLRGGRKLRANVRVRGFRRRRKNPVRGPYPFAGRDQDALRAVTRAMPAVERGGGGVYTYTGLICRRCQALWRLDRAECADVLERNLLAKTLAGDFRDLGVDARLAMAQLCALTGRPGEAHQWFERARAVLDEQGARPLRALVDLDEAWMEVRRGPHGDPDRARALLDVACEQFQAIGMPGWIERADALRRDL